MTQPTPDSLMTRGACSREGTAAEVVAGDDDVALGDLGAEVLVDVFHAVLRELGRVRNIEVSGRDDDVGVDVVPVFMCFSFYIHGIAPMNR